MHKVRGRPPFQDGLNDWGYACMRKGLGIAIAEATQRPVISAKAMSPLAR